MGLNHFRFDIDQGKATLTNGVLTLTIPKNQAGSLKTIDVESASIPSDLPTSNIFQNTLDLPGVSASSLEVKLLRTVSISQASVLWETSVSLSNEALKFHPAWTLSKHVPSCKMVSLPFWLPSTISKKVTCAPFSSKRQWKWNRLPWQK